MKREFLVVPGCIVGLAVSISPVFMNTLPVFLKSIAHETGWSRTEIISGISVATLMVMLSSPVIGRLVDRIGPRAVLISSLVPFGVALALFKFMPPVYGIYLLIAALIGLSGNCTNSFVYLSLPPQWFDRNLGLALGVSNTGIGVGQTLMPLFAAFLLVRVGWHSAYLALGATVVMVGMINALILVRENGRPAGGVRDTASANDAGTTFPGVSRGEAMRSVAFWRLFFAFLLITTVVVGCAFNMVPLLTDRGLTPAAATRVAASIGLAVLVSRFVTGFLLDRIRATVIGLLSFGGAACGVLLIWIGMTGGALFLGAVLLGLALGVEGDLMPYMIRRLFGLRAFGEIYGVLWSAFNIGVLIGPLLMAHCFDSFGSYKPMLGAFVMIAVVSALLLIGLGVKFMPFAPAVAE